ncbi:MAG: LysR family transcriptional regulator [Clostridiales bacterium]|nr:LysR family transcriptional regulator [Clostridiales bacterium]
MKQPNEIDIDTKTLRYIVAIVDEGGLAKAAEALYLSQPALSRYLRGIEEALGTPIFYRKHNRLILTAAGKVFINGARSMLHLEQEVLQQLETVRLDRSLTVTAAAQSLFIPWLEGRIQERFKARYPQFTLRLEEHSGNQVRSLVSNGTVDLGFFMGDPYETPYFSQECLFTSQLVFCAAQDSPGLARSRKEGFRLSHFSEEPMIMSLENTFLFQKQNRLMMEAGISSPNVCARGRLHILTDLLRLGYGNVILPAETPGLPGKRLLAFDPPEPYSWIAAWCQGRPLTAPAQALLMTVRENCPSHPQQDDAGKNPGQKGCSRKIQPDSRKPQRPQSPQKDHRE